MKVDHYDLLKVNTMISDQPNNGYVELNLAQDSD